MTSVAAPSTHLSQRDRYGVGTLPSDGLHSNSADALLATLEGSPESFLQPTSALHDASVVNLKSFLDPLASSIVSAQEQRQRERRKKRKRGEADDGGRPLQLASIYTDGFNVEQVWEQARRILDAAREEVELNMRGIEHAETQGAAVKDETYKDVKMVHFDDNGFEVGSSDDEDLNDAELAGEDLEEEAMEEMDGSTAGESEEHEEADGMDGISDEEDIEADEDLMNSDEEGFDDEGAATYKPDPNNLNDGFFSIDDFNRQSEYLEQTDARGDPDDGAASDEEDIDWETDPMTMPAPKLRKDGDEDELDIDEDAEDDDDEDGPTFGNADLNAESDEEDAMSEDIDDEDMGGLSNTNDIQYADFFEPPPRKLTKSTRMRALPKTQPTDRPELAGAENDIQRTMANVRRDLFDDEDVSEASEVEQADDAARPQSRRSTHEKQKAKLAEEIRRLEAANVAKRTWTLSGEARAADRPLNSALEEDLEFERAGKPVPVITAEVSEDIEALIKRRILNKEFDELIRRRPDSLSAAQQGAKRGRMELDDSKPQQSLADMYESEHLRATDPNFVDKRDAKLKKEHAEIERMWKDISSKLDALSNWHYKPKPPSASINIVGDVSTVAMEDAQPTAGGAVNATSMLAPQEVYAPGEEGKVNGEVVTKGGGPVAREEMSREQKIRRRRREKERAKKAGEYVEQKGTSGGKAGQKKALVDDLKRGGVKVIGNKGEVRDVEGKRVKGKQGPAGGGAFKL